MHTIQVEIENLSLSVSFPAKNGVAQFHRTQIPPAAEGIFRSEKFPIRKDGSYS